jgi:hypothetical protein
MNRIERGFNYGWRSGYPCDDDDPDPAFNTIPPLWYLGRATCCQAPTGITVYTGHQIPQWRNHLFMAVYTGEFYHFTLNADRTDVVSTRVVTGVTANMDLVTGPDGALWYIQGGGYQTGTLRRIVGPGAADTPTPVAPTAPPATATRPPAPPSATAPAAGPSRFFPETGKTVRGRFLEYWEANGGLLRQGFPISDEMQERSDTDGRTYTVQYFERAVFEHHPENARPYDVLLTLVGVLSYQQKYPSGAPDQAPNTAPGAWLFPETGKRLGGPFLDYWRQNGGLPQQGFPISDEFSEISELDGKPYRVQYFERAVLEYHPENSAPFQVLGSQLGTYRYRAKYPAP